MLAGNRGGLTQQENWYTMNLNSPTRAVTTPTMMMMTPSITLQKRLHHQNLRMYLTVCHHYMCLHVRNFGMNMNITLAQTLRWWMMFWYGGMSNEQCICAFHKWHWITWQFLVCLQIFICFLHFTNLHPIISYLCWCWTYFQPWLTHFISCVQPALCTVYLGINLPWILELAGSCEGLGCFSSYSSWWCTGRGAWTRGWLGPH